MTFLLFIVVILLAFLEIDFCRLLDVLKEIRDRLPPREERKP